MSSVLPVADIRPLTIHDGPGLRTTVFVKGCPLKCRWCHNPETIGRRPQLLFREKLCISCGKCFSLCPESVHHQAGSQHRIDRERCTACGKCCDACWNGALELCGKSYTPGELLPELLRDREFFGENGGVTVSGGEPLLYAGAVAELFALLRKESIHTALDTSGFAAFSAFEQVLEFTGLILFDLKGMDEQQHIANTGQSNRLILENLRRLGNGSVPLEIRMPVIPCCNDSLKEFHAAGKLLEQLPAVRSVQLLAYHDMAREKYRQCGMIDTMPQVPAPSAEHLQERAAVLDLYLPGRVLLPEN